MIDTWKSRRTKFIECTYWSQIKNPDIAKHSELSYEIQPDGFFSASILGNYTEENKTIDNAFMYRKITVTIETTDDVKELERNDIVEMKGEIYRVVDINRIPTQKQEQFLNETISYTTQIALCR